ncbi:uncharacterized protein LOC126379392 isoform X2 [Pectinophora gossypiella]|uniref:uncharacterized protein LOC126379392 isoform X2 n=1 Tax=Pectinophora gossypiella TaxID=13191 RepID=UPI00214E5600|nr:uncharacterized protein LOC126379392 isoform X2 [Pectinophora gossypiella]
MSKNLDDQTIYEIFRACRLCGAGGGYKMPIMPSVVGFDCEEIDLKRKIQDCLHIEVSPDDKMPPLICELCVDKVNDFYEFIQMCKENIARTRIRLGLPPQAMTQGNSDSGDCILGVTEAIYVEDEPPRTTKVKVKKEVTVKKDDKVKKPIPVSTAGKRKESLKRELDRLTKSDAPTTRESRGATRDVRGSSRSSTDSAAVRQTRHSDNFALSNMKAKQEQNRSGTPKPKPVLKREKESKAKVSSDDEEIPPPRPKRHREAEMETPNADTASKKVKLTVKLRSPSPPPRPRAGPKSRKLATPPPLPYHCNICDHGFQSPQGYASHTRTYHVIKYTPIELSCNPCGEWFPTSEEAALHHKRHKNKPYRCRGCKQNFKHIDTYNQHIEKTNCVPWTEVPDVKCERCWRLYPTRALHEAHSCGGPDNRPGGKCSKCNKNYLTLKNLKKHESVCAGKKRANATVEVKIAPEVRERLKSLQIRVAKCDPLLKPKRRRYDVSMVPGDYGLDRMCVYPYRSLVRIKREPLRSDGMVSINKEIQDEFYIEEDYVHWDSDLSSGSEDEYSLVNPTEKRRRVPSLTTLSLKTIFSKRCLGKVPRKLRKMKDKFDSFFNLEFDNMENDVNNIIDNLSDNDEKADTTSQDSENLLCDVNCIINSLDRDSVETTIQDSDNCVSAAKGVSVNDSDTNGAVQNDNSSVKSVNGSVNYDSVSIINNKIDKLNEEGDFDSLKNGDNASNDSELKENNGNNLVDKNNDDTESDLSSDENKTNKNTEEKDTASENSHEIEFNHVGHLNGERMSSISSEKINGTADKPNEMMKDSDDLTKSEEDKKITHELDEQIDEKQKEKAEVDSIGDKEKISLEDLMPDKIETRMELDSVSDAEFDFDA